jgi:putative Mg2+ transporter-C (MgtC) family protein
VVAGLESGVHGLTHDQLEAFIRLGVAAACGAAIGVEREITEQAAGLRTHMLVCIGSCLFTLAGIFGFVGHSVDPSRVAAQIVTGVGFLGAGAILREGMSVHGLTTAASLWVTAAVGLAVGTGMYWVGGFAVVVTLLSLWVLRPLRRRLRRISEATEPDD